MYELYMYSIFYFRLEKTIKYKLRVMKYTRQFDRFLDKCKLEININYKLKLRYNKTKNRNQVTS